MAEQPEAQHDYSHIRFPDIPTAQANRDALNRKLSEIQAAFDELDRLRQELQRLAHGQQIQADAQDDDRSAQSPKDPGGERRDD